MLSVKDVLNGEKAVRKFDVAIEEILIDQLVREDLSSEEKKHIAEEAKKLLADNSEWEEKNSDYWYKVGIEEGKCKGIWIGVGALVLGYLTGNVLFRK